MSARLHRKCSPNKKRKLHNDGGEAVAGIPMKEHSQDGNQTSYYVMAHVIDGGQCISAELLTNAYFLDDDDRRNRHYTKGIIEKEFSR